MSTENKIEFYFLRISAERFASDLQHFQKEISDLSDDPKGTFVSFANFYFKNFTIKLV